MTSTSVVAELGMAIIDYPVAGGVFGKDVFVAVRLGDLPKLFFRNFKVLAKLPNVLRRALAVVLFDRLKTILPAHAAKADKLAHFVGHLAEAELKILDHLIDEDK